MPNLTLTTQPGLERAVSIGPHDISNPRDLNREIWKPDPYPLADALLRALRHLVADEPRSSRRATLVEEHDVTALSSEADGRTYATYAQLAAYAADSRQEWLRLLKTTRQLGMSTDYGQSSLDDVVVGPVQILTSAEIDAPTITFDFSEFFELKSNQRESLLAFICRLTPGVDVRLVASYRVQRRLLDQHRDQLPASVIDAAESGLLTPSAIATRTEERRDHVRDLLADRGDSHVDWDRLQVIYQEPQQRCSYNRLESHPLTDFGSRDALKQFVKRMRDADLVEAYGSPHDRHVRLLPAGYALLDVHPDVNVQGGSSRAGGAGGTDDTSQPGSSDADTEQATVSAPPTYLNSPVYPPTAPQNGSDRPAGEPRQAAAGGSGSGSASAVATGYLDGDEHDAFVAMADDGEIALCERPAADPDDRRGVQFSFLEARDELVVRINASDHVARTMVRLCAALLSEPAFQQVLTRDRLAGGPEKNGLDGLPVTNPYVLRSGACLGYLQNADATAKAYRRRLRAARNELLVRMSDIDWTAESTANGAIAQLAADAHGLAGTVSRIYDMLGVDIHRVVDVPDWAVENDDRRRHLVGMLAKQTTIASRYGVYSAYRVLYEPREDKREQLLGTPDVSPADPVGDVCGSWVLVGDKVGSLREDLEDLDERLGLQEDGEHFAPFTLGLSVVDGNRREAYATALSRRLSLTNLEATRQAISLFRALTRDVLAASRAVRYGLHHDNNGREIDLFELRPALSVLEADEIVPEFGGRVVSEVILALLDVDGPITRSDLAELIGRSGQAFRDNEDSFDELETLGLLERTDLGPGRGTEWRLTLPFGDERGKESAPTPTLIVGESGPYGVEWATDTALAELLLRLRDGVGRDLPGLGADLVPITTGTAYTGDIDTLVECYSEHWPVIRLLLQLLDEDVPVSVDDQDAVDAGVESLATTEAAPTVQLGLDPSPDSTQTSLSTAQTRVVNSD